MPVEISTAQLAQLANRPDVELRVEGEGNQAQLRDDREGWWGGRLARNLKIKFGEEDRDAKQTQYDEATKAVRAALIRDYGEEIGEKAFRAGKGHQVEEDGWEYSRDHPITGRHIERMISAAEAELKRNDAYRVVEFDRGGFRNTKGERVSGPPVQMWFRDSVNLGRSPDSDEWRRSRQGENFREELDHLQYEGQSGASGFERMRFVAADTLVGGEGQPDEWRAGLSHGDFIARRLLGDTNARLQNEPESEQDFWRLAVQKSDEERVNTIGIRIDRNHPDTVHVFDPNWGEAAVPRTRLAGWLGHHLKDTYGEIGTTDLRRVATSQPEGEFTEFTGGAVDRTIRAEELAPNKREVLDDLWHNKDLEPRPGLAPLNSQFLIDLPRQTMVVEGPQGDGITRRQLTLENCDRLLSGLVPDDIKDQAPTKLSSLLGQTAFNAMLDAFHGSLRGERLEPLALVGPKLAEDQLTTIRRYVDGDSDGEEGIEITYHRKLPLSHVHSGELVPLAPDRDYCRDTMTIRVSFDALARDGVPDYTIVGQPTREYHIEPPRTGEMPARGSDLTFAKDERGVMVSGLGDLVPIERRALWVGQVNNRIDNAQVMILGTGHTVSDDFMHGLPKGSGSLAFDGGFPRPLRPTDPVGERLSDGGLTRQEVTEVSKLIDRSLADRALCDAMRGLGMTDDEICEFLNTGRNFGIRIDREENGALSVTLSSEATGLLADPRIAQRLGGLPEDSTGHRLDLSLTFRLQFEDGVPRHEMVRQQFEFSPVDRLCGANGMEFRGGQIDKSVRLDQNQRTQFQNRITNDLKNPPIGVLQTGPGNQPVHKDFLVDTDRLTITVQGPEVRKRLTPDTALVDLRDLVGGEGQEQVRAVRRLTQLLNMTSASAVSEPLLRQCNDESGAIIPGNNANPVIRVRRQGEYLEISYSSESRFSRVGGPDSMTFYTTSPETDSFATSATIRVSLQALRGYGNPEPEIVAWPNGRLHIEGYRGIESDSPLDPQARPELIELEERDGVRVVELDGILPGRSSWLQAMKEQVKGGPMVSIGNRKSSEYGWETLARARLGTGLELRDAPVLENSLQHASDLHGQLSERLGVPGTEQLSRLFDGEFVERAFRATAAALGATHEDMQLLAGAGGLAIDVQPTDDGYAVTLTRISDDLFRSENVARHLQSQGIEPDTHALDLSMTLRVRRQDLIDGVPERFALLGGPRLEARQKPVRQ